jgi:hypothetical protein
VCHTFYRCPQLLANVLYGDGTHFLLLLSLLLPHQTYATRLLTFLPPSLAIKGFVFYPPANFSIRDVKNIMGILIAIVGMILYGHIKASALFPIIAMVIRVLMITIYTH